MAVRGFIGAGCGVQDVVILPRAGEAEVFRRAPEQVIEVAKSPNPRPQGQGVTIWLGLRTPVRFPFPPPKPKIPTLIGWDFFCPERQCWRGFRPWPLEHAPPEVVVFGVHSAVFLSLFSAALLSIQGPKSWIGAGLQGIGLLLRLLWRARPRQRKAQKNRPEAACRCGTDVSASLSPVPHVAPTRTPTTCRVATG